MFTKRTFDKHFLGKNFIHKNYEMSMGVTMTPIDKNGLKYVTKTY